MFALIIQQRFCLQFCQLAADYLEKVERTSDVIESSLMLADSQIGIVLVFLKIHRFIILHQLFLSLPNIIRSHSHGVAAVAYLK